jgi:hypothetical protein
VVRSILERGIITLDRLSGSISPITTLDAGFEALTDGAHVVAIRASEEEGGAVLACNEIPSGAAAATG